MASTGVEKYRQSRPSMAAQKINISENTPTRTTADFIEILPAGIARSEVRGFNPSNFASTIRLNPIAADRALTMANSIHKISIHPMTWFREARTTADSANGKAKTVWLNLTILPYTITSAANDCPVWISL